MFDRTSNKFGKQRRVGATLTFQALGSGPYRDRRVKYRTAVLLALCLWLNSAFGVGEARCRQAATPVVPATPTRTPTPTPSSTPTPPANSLSLLTGSYTNCTNG